MKKILLRLILVAVALTILAAIIFWLAYDRVGKTPGELMDYAEIRLQGHPRLELIALPIIGKIRNYLDQPAPEMRAQQHFFVPQPPPQETSDSLDTSPTSAITPAFGNVLRVGPNESIVSIAQAAKIAKERLR